MDESPPASPADRFRAASLRAAHAKTALAEFERRYDFPFDQFQIDACRFLESGLSVLVAAPTGSGKTVVGEFAVELAIQSKGRAFYTTPIKALSNQKFRDLGELFGSENVGLLTGDTVHNADAAIVVMTTEVLRNMIYERSPALTDLLHVIMDEVHYLADRQRGAVWEEVILQLPSRVAITALSATVSNAEEFGAWLTSVRGDTGVIVEERRPVPLHQHVLTTRGMHDLFVDVDQTPQVNPELARQHHDGPYRRGRQTRSRHPRQRRSYIRRDFTVDMLASQGLLPAIVFIFSRKGCDDAVEQILGSGIRLTSEAERQAIAEAVDSACRQLPDADLAVLEFDAWRDALLRGVAAHHAGLLPLFKEVVERLFCEGLVKLVYATETLALGINMPARTVVMERLVKWNGTAHVDLTAGEYTQLTGRAGRRGIDHEGHAVTLWRDDLDVTNLAGLAAKRTYPLRSSFRPTYNMAVNLIDQVGYSRARSLLEASFAQFQADAGVAGIAAKIRKHEEALTGYQASMECHLGDFSEYAALREEISRREKANSKAAAAANRAVISDALADLRVGEIVGLPLGRRMVPAVVVESADPDHPDPRPQVLTIDRRVKRVSAAEMGEVPSVKGRMKVSRDFDGRSANQRRDLARRLAEVSKPMVFPKPSGRRQTTEDHELASLRSQMRAHPCHGCHDREAHARWGSRYHKLLRETDVLKQQMQRQTGTLGRQFDSVCRVLRDLNYLDLDGNEYQRTGPDADILAGIYGEQDLLVAQSLRSGAWNDLEPADLAAIAASIVYEERSADAPDQPPTLPPSRPLRAAIRSLAVVADELRDVEGQQGLRTVNEPDPRISEGVWHWCRGASLREALGKTEMSVGDFVRSARQVIDLLSQISAVAPTSGLRESAAMAADSMRRGIVDYSAIEV